MEMQGFKKDSMWLYIQIIDFIQYIYILFFIFYISPMLPISTFCHEFNVTQVKTKCKPHMLSLWFVVGIKKTSVKYCYIHFMAVLI